MIAVLERDKKLKNIRPVIDIEDEYKDFPDDVQAFRHQSLRQVLKLQNPLIIAFFKDYLAKNRPDFIKLTDDEQRLYIRTALKNDSSVKLMLIGIGLGQLTYDEFTFFLNHRADLMYLITEMLTRRLCDQLPVFQQKQHT